MSIPISTTLGIDFRQLPDDTFTVIENSDNKITYKKVDKPNAFLGLFSTLTIYCLKGKSYKTYLFGEPSKEIDIQTLAGLIMNLHIAFGDDNDGNGFLMQDEVESIREHMWFGRTWDSTNLGAPAFISAIGEEGLSFIFSEVMD